ncbi:cytochrome P450 [Acrocarpospora phusangensis]|uniref:Cytochrome P450 n=1 Tax=Acrocarpospora phusangensis TaxID=1070424 RepID=A0A919UUH6_9ACTN|nr:cytochrome P450 [Acrocarpospora phusangensis]GIH28430.1 cytochrome P450 [Acrocarpospora phusangensis]
MPQLTQLTPAAPGGLPLLGHIPSLVRHRLAFMEEMRDHGGVVRVRLGRTPAYVISDARIAREVVSDGGTTFARGRFFRKLRPLLGDGLGTSDGPFHMRQRRMVQPAFHHSRPGYDIETMRAVIEARTSWWQPGMTLDIAKEMDRLGVALITKTLFSSDTAAGEVQDVQESIADFMVGVGIRTVVPSDLLERLPIPANRRFNAARDRLERAITKVIADYRADQRDHHDILSMLLAARDAEGLPMTDQQLRDEVLSLVVAGGDTTGHVLGWIFHELGQHPEVERRLHDELDQVLAGRTVTADDLPKLGYAEQVVNETLRRRSPGWLVMRRTTRALELGGVPIPADAELLVSPSALLRDPAVYPDPMRFDPDRWAPDRVGSMPRDLFLPFGAGTRKCAGEPLARISMALVLATLPTRFRLRPVPGHQVRELALGTMSADKIPMTLEPRDT